MPITEKRVLANGQHALLEMPDMFALVSGQVNMPNSALADVLQLIAGDDFALDPKEQLRINKAKVAGIYEVTALCMAEPKLTLCGTPKDGELTPRDLAWGDVVGIYAWFRLGGSNRVSTPEDSESPGSTEPPQTSDTVSHDSE